ncbi:DEAD/DEAH box helicase family protein [Enterococcus italicus]|uniref:DEAD/DEAH box helicase family protein n=1 Tax=Enterococcus italicus TaxID=246144 RepID=UPI0028A5EE90|nr:DEAD/DEAH box helicase family protein [Enterococcus italicus]
MFATDLKNLKVMYNSSIDDIIGDFFDPVLKNSISYDRETGYFSSKVLVQYIKGLEGIVARNGKIRLIISPYLSVEDGMALIYSQEKNNDLVYTVREMFQSFLHGGEITITSAQLLFALIKEKYLEVKVIKPKSMYGLFHEKTAIFTDEVGDLIGITGSNNETNNALTANIESFMVFSSWKNGSEEYLFELKRNFERSWKGEFSDNWQTLSLMDCVEQDIFNSFQTDESIHDLFERISNKSNCNLLAESMYEETDISINLNYTPYDYQKDAADKWLEKKSGIISFATGTGKTKTAILCIKKVLEKDKIKIILCLVPDKTLLEQWFNELVIYSNNIVKCYSENNKWKVQLKDKIDEYKIIKEKPLFVISTIQTFKTSNFQKQLVKMENDIFLISDECHRLATENTMDILPSYFEYKLGLSATPEIYLNQQMTEKLSNYFGGVVAEYSLDQAIENGFLVPYEYYPIEVQLTDNEREKYKELSHQLVKLLGTSDENEMRTLSLEAQMILFKRSRILYGASEKMEKLPILLEEIDSKKHLIIYCGVTSPAEDTELMRNTLDTGMNQLKRVNSLLQEKDFVFAKYTKDENGIERADRIEAFKKGDIDILVAIKALDEGVDIPEISTGIILASSGNPREFIQRRGRLLRKSTGKDKAIIYDLVVIDHEEQSVSKNEYKRMYEFSRSALNKKELFSKYREEFTSIEQGECINGGE